MKHASIDALGVSNNKWCYDKVSMKNDTCAAESNINTNISMQTVDNECVIKRNRLSTHAKYVSNSNELSDKIETLSKKMRFY